MRRWKTDILRNKRGVSIKSIIIWVIIIAIIFLWLTLHYNCEITSKESLIMLFVKKYILFCKISPGFFEGIIAHPLTWLKDTLGFNESFWSFIPSLLMGVFVGLWIWIAYVLAIGLPILFINQKWLGGSAQNNLAYIKSTWLGFLVGSYSRGSKIWEFIGGIWKIIPIAVGYAVLTRIPIVNKFLELITFEVLGVSPIWRSLILAFYIGFLPATIEEYTKYRLRMRYYNELLKFKYNVKKIQSI